MHVFAKDDRVKDRRCDWFGIVVKVRADVDGKPLIDCLMYSDYSGVSFPMVYREFEIEHLPGFQKER
jgi:hypothetical protein